MGLAIYDFGFTIYDWVRGAWVRFRWLMALGKGLCNPESGRKTLGHNFLETICMYLRVAKEGLAKYVARWAGYGYEKKLAKSLTGVWKCVYLWGNF